MATNVGSATIAQSGTLSNSVKIGDNILLGVVVPTTWTAAVVTFLGSLDNITFYNLNNYSGGAVSATVASGEFSQVDDPLAFAPWNYVQVRSGTKASPVAQAAAATVTLLLEEHL